MGRESAVPINANSRYEAQKRQAPPVCECQVPVPTVAPPPIYISSESVQGTVCHRPMSCRLGWDMLELGLRVMHSLLTSLTVVGESRMFTTVAQLATLW